MLGKSQTNSAISLPLNFKVQSNSSKPLPAPSVDGVSNGLIDGALTFTTVRIPQYPGMSVGDIITVIWSAPLPTQGTVTVQVTGPQTLKIDGTFIAGNLNKNVSVTYSVSGRGTSEPPVVFHVQPATIVPGELLIPKAPNKRLNVHNDMYEDDFLVVEVPPYSGMAQGQSITVEWIGPYFTWTSPVQWVDSVRRYQFNIPRLEVVDAIGSSMSVRYTVNNTFLSPMFQLIIDGQGMNMPPPQFNTLGGGRYSVSLLSPDQQVGHTGRVRCSGSTVHDSQNQQLEPSRREDFDIPAAWVNQNAGRDVLINYSIYRGNGEKLRFSRVLRRKL
ncbi:hypothetical protein ACX3X6_09580 [Pseudomonas sichuanensis]